MILFSEKRKFLVTLKMFTWYLVTSFGISMCSPSENKSYLFVFFYLPFFFTSFTNLMLPMLYMIYNVSDSVVKIL